MISGFLLSGIKILREWERAPRLTLGRYRGLKGPGIIYVPPFISKVPYIISTRLQVLTFKTEQTFTRDNVPVNVDAVMYYQPVNVEKATLNVENYSAATQLAAQTTLRETIGGVSSTIYSMRGKRSVQLLRDNRFENGKLGHQGHRCRNKRHHHPCGSSRSNVKTSSSRTGTKSENHSRRGRVPSRSQKMVDAANLYSANPRAMELRWMNILYELGLQGRGTLMLIPTNMPTAGAGLTQPVVSTLNPSPKEKKTDSTINP